MASQEDLSSSFAGMTIHQKNTASSSALATPSTVQGSQEARNQAVMKNQMEDEIKNATYTVDLTKKKGDILYADPNIVASVFNNLRTTFQGLTSTGKSSETHPRFQKNGFKKESKSYKPLVHLLNRIIETATPHISSSYLTGLRFHHHEKEMEERHGSFKGLKPDVVGTIGGFLTEDVQPEAPESSQGAEKPDKEPVRRPLSWRQVEVVVESKKTLRDMIRQSGTYARCCVLSNQRRSISLGIGFLYDKLEAYVFLFHHGGLSSSDKLELTTEEGFKGLVKYIVGILSIKNEAAYGMDTTRFGDYFHLNTRYYKSIGLLHIRGTLRGRSTTVHRLEVDSNIPETDKRKMISRKLILSESAETKRATRSSSTRLPNNITYKLSYPIKDQCQEGPLLSKFIGQFGIADVIGYYDCGVNPEDPHGSTGQFLKDAKFWKVFEQKDQKDQPIEPEERGLQCIALFGEGKALIDLDDTAEGTPSPGELLESILHAIIGHYNLFQKGVLHRDVSSGNMMRYLNPIERPPLDEFDCTRNVKLCRGFLIDGDQAIKWRNCSSSQRISGTMSFMSIQLLVAMQMENGTIHTALDDLESFLWLLIWGIVQASKDIEGARAANKGIELMLHAYSGDERTNNGKFSIAQKSWRDAVFGGLIKEWLRIFDRVGEETREGLETMPKLPLNDEAGSQWQIACDWLESHCINAYEEILESGFKHLEDVKKYSSWDDVVAKNSEVRLKTFTRTDVRGKKQRCL